MEGICIKDTYIASLYAGVFRSKMLVFMPALLVLRPGILDRVDRIDDVDEFDKFDKCK